MFIYIYCQTVTRWIVSRNNLYRSDMMRGLIIKTLIFLFLLLALELNISSIITADIFNRDISDNVIIVSKIGGDYSYIQEAIENAIDGSIILVKSGFYSEIIDIRKSITIIGENKFTTMINPISNENKYAIRFDASEIVIKNLSITNGASGLYSTGIRINSPNNEIYNCNIYNNPIGIAVFSSNNLIDNCDFWNCYDEAIALIGTEISRCDNNTIINCNIFNNCDGIEMQRSCKNNILNCLIFNNSHSGIDAIISSNDYNNIGNCKIYNNNVNGIYLSSSSNNNITNCIFYGNKNSDFISNDESKDNIFIENDFEDKSLKYIDTNFYCLNNQEDSITNNTIDTEIKIKNNLYNIIEMITNIFPILKKLF